MALLRVEVVAGGVLVDLGHPRGLPLGLFATGGGIVGSAETLVGRRLPLATDLRLGGVVGAEVEITGSSGSLVWKSLLLATDLRFGGGVVRAEVCIKGSLGSLVWKSLL